MSAIETIEAHSEVVVDTEDLPREDWLKYRKIGIGGSDAAVAAGLSDWSSPYSLFYDKTGDYVDETENQFTIWGKRLEGVVGEAYAEETGNPVIRYPKMLRSKKYPFMVCNMDFLAPDLPAVVEVKTTSFHNAINWDEGAVPTGASLQGQHMLSITGLERVDYPVLIGGNDFRIVTVERNDALIESLINIEGEFWDLVKANTPPEIDGHPATRETILRIYGNPCALAETELPPESLGLLAEREQRKQIIKQEKERIEELENQLFVWMGQHEIGNVAGKTVMTWKLQHRRGYEVQPTSFRKIHCPKPSTKK